MRIKGKAVEEVLRLYPKIFLACHTRHVRDSVTGQQLSDHQASILDHLDEVEPTSLVRENAIRFLRVHPLRAADALQLAAAFVAAERRPASLQVLTLDERLAEAMRKEGFALVDIAAW